MLFLYNLPVAAMGAIVVLTIVSAALLGYALFRRLVPMRLDAEQRGMSIAMMSAVTTINSLLVAFSAVSVWNAYQSASDVVSAEASCATELAHDLASFRKTDADVAGRALAAYLQRVADDEWPRMQQHGEDDPATADAFHAMFAAVNRIVPVDVRQRVLLGEVMTRVNEMVKYRQSRLQSLDAAMPATLWVVMLVSSALSFLLLYALPGSRFNVWLVTVWAVTLGLAFFFVLAVDHPFAGTVSVSADPIRRSLVDIRADTELFAAPPR